MDQLETVRALGFDDRFMRMWEYYLALSEAGFATGISQDLQIVFEKRRGLEAAGAGLIRGRCARLPSRPMDRLRERVILITGSTGIAAATAVRCAAEGASVFVVSRSADHARALAERLVRVGAAVGWVAADLADAAAADGAVACRRRSGSGGWTARSRWPAGAAGGTATGRSTS